MQGSTHRPASAVRAKAGAIFRVTSGNFLEQFDFFLFGFYASQIAAVFFPSSSEFASLMMTFAVFGAGFLMRPLGAVVLGAYIDDVGRRKGLIVTLSIMASGTILIVLVPGYDSIGLLAPALVLIGRLLQGFSAGAELGGVSVYLSEIATPGRKGFFTSWQSASQQVAIIIAAALGYALNQWLSATQIAEWGWRIPFLVGCMIVPFIFLLRRNLQETEEFAARRHRPSMGEVFATLVQNWGVVVGGMLMVALTTTAFYLITVYAPTFGKTVLHLSTSDALLVTLLVGVSNFFWLPLGGALSDRIGRRPVLIAMTLLTLASAYPMLSFLVQAPSFIHMLLVLLWLSFLYGLYNGAMVAALTEIMPVEVRVAGFSLAYSLATAIFGGFTPAISTFLIQYSGDKAAPGYWMSFAALCALCATLFLYRRSSPGLPPGRAMKARQRPCESPPMSKFLNLVALLLIGALSGGAQAEDLHVMTSGGFTAAYKILGPKFAAASGNTLQTTLGPSMGQAPEAIPNRLARGEQADVVIMVGYALDDLIKQGKIRPDSRVELADSRIGMVVKAGETPPAIDSPAALKATLLNARSVAYSDSASGVYIQEQLFKRLGIEPQLKPKAKMVPKIPVASVVASGDYQVGFQQVSELLPVPGVTYVGKIPESLQSVTRYAAGIALNAAHPEQAKALLQYLAAPAAQADVKATGLDSVSP